jgi:translocation and assembly module TamA
MLYSMPLKNPATEQLTMSSHYVEQRTESRKTNAGGLDLRRITGYKSWRQAIAISYEREGYEVADESGSSQLLMPNVDWLHNKFNNRLFPTRGFRFTGEIWLSNKIWYSDVNFIQLQLTGKSILPIFSNGRIIIKAQGGATLINEIGSLPASKRFYAGGDQTIRGYGYEELGPKNEQGQTIGGKYLAVAGIEYEHRIFKDWGLAIFFDLGNSFTNVQEKIYRGVGIGGRWRSKVGPIRLDFAWPLDKTVEYPRLHLTIGLDL